MAGETPRRVAGTTRRGETENTTPRILHHRAPCANCGTPLYPREFRHCAPCLLWLRAFKHTQAAHAALRMAKDYNKGGSQ